MINPYEVGEVPVLCPCDECIVGVTCSSYCKSYQLWRRHNMEKPEQEIRVRGKKRTISVRTYEISSK